MHYNNVHEHKLKLMSFHVIPGKNLQQITSPTGLTGGNWQK